MRVCFVCDEYPPGNHGGIGSFVRMLARALVDVGHEVKVVGLYPADHPSPRYEEDQGVQVWRLRQSHWRLGWIGGRYKVFRQIASWAKNGEIDLVEVVDFGGPAAYWPKLPVPVVARLHGSGSYFAAELNSKVSRRLFQLESSSLRRADVICSVSRHTADRTRELFNLPSCPDAVVYNFVDSRFEVNSRSRSNDVVIFSGTLTYKKGVVPLIKAWPTVLAKNANAKLHFYGKDGCTDDGESMTAMLRSQLDESQQQSVRFHGHTDREDLLEALKKARLAIFPSYAEAFALAPLEAMAEACPTIYSERGCGRELVSDGKDGVLIDPDRPDQIADAIVTFLNDDNLVEKLGTAGQERVRQSFSTQAVLPQNIDFYRSCIDNAKHR